MVSQGHRGVSDLLWHWDRCAGLLWQVCASWGHQVTSTWQCQVVGHLSRGIGSGTGGRSGSSMRLGALVVGLGTPCQDCGARCPGPLRWVCWVGAAGPCAHVGPVIRWWGSEALCLWRARTGQVLLQSELGAPLSIVARQASCSGY